MTKIFRKLLVLFERRSHVKSGWIYTSNTAVPVVSVGFWHKLCFPSRIATTNSFTFRNHFVILLNCYCDLLIRFPLVSLNERGRLNASSPLSFGPSYQWLMLNPHEKQTTGRNEWNSNKDVWKQFLKRQARQMSGDSISGLLLLVTIYFKVA